MEGMSVDEFFVEDEPLEAIEAALASGRPVVTARSVARFELFTTSNGQFRFTLKSANGVILATSEGYETEAAALAAIESVKATAAAAQVESLAG